MSHLEDTHPIKTNQEYTMSDINKKTVAIDSPTPEPQPKVIGATAGAGVGAAVTTIVLWAVEEYAGVELPIAVQGAALVLVSAIVAFVGGYIPKLRVYSR